MNMNIEQSTILKTVIAKHWALWVTVLTAPMHHQKDD